MSSPALLTTSVGVDASITEVQVTTLRQQFKDLSTDFYILHGEFGQEDLMKQFLSQKVSWFHLEMRCTNLRTEIQALGQDPTTSSVPKIVTEYTSIVSEFNTILAQLAGLRVSLEGPQGHVYSAKNARFQLIGNQQGPALPLVAAKKPKKHPRDGVSTGSKTVAMTDNKTSHPFASSTSKSRKSIGSEETPSKSSRAPAIQPPLTKLKQPSLNFIRTTTSATSNISEQDLTELHEHIIALERTTASMKDSLQKLNESNEKLRHTIQEKGLEVGRKDMENLEIRGTIRDYRDFVDELAAIVDKHDPAFLQERGELKGGKVIINLENRTKLWVDRSNGDMEIRDVEAERNDIEGQKIMKRQQGNQGKGKSVKVEDGDANDKDTSGDFEPAKRRKSGRDN